MLTYDMKMDINSRVIKDCVINGAEIVADRMTISKWVITLHKTVHEGARIFRTKKIFIETFVGDSYDVQQRKEELQKIVPPIGRIKYFSAEKST